jgi:acetyl esterase/lipase
VSAPGAVQAVNYFRLLVALAIFAVSLLAIRPAPTYRAWQLSVGVTEWGHVFALIPLILFLPGFSKTVAGRLAAFLGLLAIMLGLSTLLRVSPIAQALPGQLIAAYGGMNPRQMQGAYARTQPFVARELITPPPLVPVRIDTMTYVIRDGKPLGVDLYRPARQPVDLLPLVIVIHGGSWRGGSRADLPELNRYLAARGYAVAAISYRFAPQFRHPAPSDDVQRSIQFLKSIAPRLGIDAGRIALIGRSAGGQLALLAAYTTRDPAIRGVAAMYSPSDQVFGYENPANPRVINSRQILEDYLAGTPKTKPEAYRTASPINFVTAATVPTLLIHGVKDELVWVRQSERLDAKLAAAKRPHFLLKLPWATHGCDYNFNGPCGQLTTYAIENFLGEVMR